MRINVSPEIFANLRFTYSPLIELSLSYVILRSGTARALYWRWFEQAQQALHGIELPYMEMLIGSHYQVDTEKPTTYIPDFLTPTPLEAHLTIEDELKHLAAIPESRLMYSLEQYVHYFGENELICEFITYPRQSLQALIEELRTYWYRTLDPHWRQMKSMLENNVLHQSRVLTLHGIEALLPQLHETLRYEQGAIIAVNDKKGIPHKPHEFQITGDALYLTSSMFSGDRWFHQFDTPWEPMLLYPARGTGLWNGETPDPSEALELTLGAGRAQVLTALNNPASTGELATILSLTSGAVSQQLGKLHKAGLVESHRSGRHVFYRLSDRGQQLVALFS